ncbi:DNA polymerase III subunit beta [Kineococcus radiotolerans]|uniref:DNA polymerase III, beta subunit n=1 Tax=Kineococcus radiotolerans (strain ATCC BAA-149 / DSM 14245 / SRS30216) TaxID=266940 RepID=A6W8W6_KINRD|nr:DNA polymerase III subunit beta [Kineococcus radiotolerans]ABS03255.1 DNA polymerase III, beta subunit [Kineococcus radiotolerans SRS30216 = ATCC BAA-149]
MTTVTEPVGVGEDAHAPHTFVAGVDSKALAEALTDVNALIGRRPPVPILAGVRLDVEGDQLTLRRTNYDVVNTATLQLPQVGHPARSTVVSASAFAAIVRAIGPGASIILTLLHRSGREFLRIAGDGVTYQLITMDAGDWPAIPADEVQHIATVSADDVQALALAGTAATSDFTLPIIHAVRLTERQGSLVAAATDRFRLLDVNTLHPVPAGFQALVPTDALEHIARLAKREGEVTISTVDEFIVFVVGSRSCRVKCVDGEYPKVDSLWPPESPIAATVDRGDLARALRRLMVATPRNTPVELAFGRNVVVLIAGDKTDLDATTTVATTLTGAEAFDAALNPQFLLDGLDAVGGDRVTFAFTVPYRPVVITGGRPNTRYLQMPVRRANGSH